jgi:hypothetical protein
MGNMMVVAAAKFCIEIHGG